MAERMKTSRDSTDIWDGESALKSAIEVMTGQIEQAAKPAWEIVAEAIRRHGLEERDVRFFPGMQPQTAIGTQVDMPPLRLFGCAPVFSEAQFSEEYTDEYDWPEAEAAWEAISGSIQSAPEPLILLPYCDGCYSPLMARRDEAMLETVLFCKTCGERQRITDRDREERLSEADAKRLEDMQARAQG